jgi:hypothetical protein
MVDMIKDGTGAGFLAEVTAQNRLSVTAITETENKDINDRTQESYLLYIDITPTGALDNFMYVKNTSDDNMFINWYRVWTESTNEAIDLYRGMTGVPSGTTTVTPVNMNFGSSNTATGDFYEGVDITNLTGGTLLDRLRISGDGKDVVDGYPGDIIIPKGGSMVLQALTGAIPLEVTLSFYYKAVTT